MLNVFLSILPIFSLIVIGYVAKNYFVKSEEFWAASDKLVYYVFFPSLLILKIAHAQFEGVSAKDGLIVAIAATTFIAIAVFAYKFVLSPANELFTSIFQGSVRYNSYIFIASSQAIFGTNGAALSGIFIATMIIFTNVITVMVMNHYGTGSKKGMSSILSKTAQNPLIIGAVIGVALNLGHIHIEGTPLAEIMNYLGSAATPLSLMSVGAGLIFVMDRHKKIAISSSILAKLIILPLVAFAILKGFNLTGLAASIALLYCAVPCAGNAYIMARQMGGDTVAMASIITWGTIVSVLTIPVFMILSGV
ncbi:AEC family transporter [Marinomonas sp. TI.3.20]|uniref:AEC family transporter n=1 Tax=Marinomonas sp. TI.3.20 TaxID=3121296 RepID=UPI00311EE322